VMKSNVDLLEDLKNKIEKIIQNQQQNINIINNLKNENEKLKNRIEDLELICKEKQKDVLALKFIKSLENTHSNDLKMKINEMLREINKCIAFLDK